jgi:hypothetical protein
MEDSVELSSKVDAVRLLSRDFKIQKIAWNSYEIDHKKAKGKFRLLSILSDLFEVRADSPAPLLPPPEQKLPQFQPVFGNLSRFLNEGEKGERDQTPFTQEEFSRRPREDISSSIKNRDEPINHYTIPGEHPLLLTTQTKLARVSLVRFRWNSFGDPIIVAESNTTHSVVQHEPEKGEMAPAVPSHD